VVLIFLPAFIKEYSYLRKFPMKENVYEHIPSYKESFYNFKLELGNEKLLIYNSKTGAISLIGANKKNTVLGVLKGGGVCEDNSLMEGLFKQGFIIKSDKNEFNDIKVWHENYGRLKNLIQLTILPAEACNFACPYCFVYQQRNLFMEEWVYDAIYKYIAKRVLQNSKGMVLQLSWFGGEPLLVSDKVIAFMNKINRLKSPYNNLVINSTIYTNGYLLTVDLFELLLESGISTFQITIDGDRDSHDQLRRLQTGEPTFDIIYNNLKNISELIGKEKDFKLYIRANFLKSGIESMDSFLYKFVKDFGQDQRFHIFFRPVYHFKTTRNDVKKIAGDICDSPEGVKRQIELAYKVLNALSKDAMDEMIDVFNPLPQPIYTWCTGRSKNVHIIGADGAVFSCDTLMMEKDKSVGEITPDGEITLNERAKFWKKSIFDDDSKHVKDCLTCKLLPVCLGGCKLSRLVSGQKACFWSEEVIFDSMKKYADLVLEETKV
jgi:uncharacterized protein